MNVESVGSFHGALAVTRLCDGILEIPSIALKVLGNKEALITCSYDGSSVLQRLKSATGSIFICASGGE